MCNFFLRNPPPACSVFSAFSARSHVLVSPHSHHARNRVCGNSASNFMFVHFRPSCSGIESQVYIRRSSYLPARVHAGGFSQRSKNYDALQPYNNNNAPTLPIQYVVHEYYLHVYWHEFRVLYYYTRTRLRCDVCA